VRAGHPSTLGRVIEQVFFNLSAICVRCVFGVHSHTHAASRSLARSCVLLVAYGSLLLAVVSYSIVSNHSQLSPLFSLLLHFSFSLSLTHLSLSALPGPLPLFPLLSLPLSPIPSVPSRVGARRRGGRVRTNPGALPQGRPAATGKGMVSNSRQLE
jgi:hypothetical protein